MVFNPMHIQLMTIQRYICLAIVLAFHCCTSNFKSECTERCQVFGSAKYVLALHGGKISISIEMPFT
jgi:hypothetical protein